MAKVNSFISRKQNELLELRDDLIITETKKCEMQKKVNVTQLVLKMNEEVSEWEETQHNDLEKEQKGVRYE